MPELPDVEMFRKEAEKCKNAEIENFRKSDSRFVKFSDNDFNKSLKGKKFSRVMRHGKYLFLVTGKNTAVVLHFGMSGSLDYMDSEKEEPRYTRCSFLFRNNHTLHVLSRRKLGYVDFTENVDDWIQQKDLGPDALEIKKEDFRAVVSGSSSMIKTVITNQAVLSGIGNEYADEILFQAKIHPRERADHIPGNKVDELFALMQKVLKTAIEKEADVSKLPNTYILPVRKKGNECPSCGGKIETTKISGRTTYFCPSCQKIAGA